MNANTRANMELRARIENILRDMRRQVIAEPENESGHLFGNCSVCARHVIRAIGHGDVWGYASAPEIGAKLGAALGEGGHDFAIIGPYLVDHWANDYHDTPWLYDLRNPDDRATVRLQYGNPELWEHFDTITDRFLPGAGDHPLKDYEENSTQCDHRQ